VATVDAILKPEECEAYFEAALKLMNRRNLKLPMPEIIRRQLEARLETRYDQNNQAYPRDEAERIADNLKAHTRYGARTILSHAMSLAVLLKVLGVSPAEVGKQKVLRQKLGGVRILHLAEGHAELATFLRENFGTESTAVDIGTLNAEIAKRIFPGAKIVKIDFMKLRERNHYDVVISNTFLAAGYPPHIPPEKITIPHVRLMLRKGGHLILTGASPNVAGMVEPRELRNWAGMQKERWDKILTRPLIRARRNQIVITDGRAIRRVR